MNTIALLLAAGDSKRFGDDKRFVGTPPLLARTLLSLYSTFDHIVMVHKLTDDLSQLPIDPAIVKLVAHDKTQDASLGASIATGMNAILALNDTPDLCAICLGDMPFIQPTTLHKLIQLAQAKCLASSSMTTICRPVLHEKVGHPVIFSKSLFFPLAQLEKQEGAKALIKNNIEYYHELEYSDLGVCIDIDTKETAKLHGIV